MTRAAVNSLCEQLLSERSRFGLHRGATAKQWAAFTKRLTTLGCQPVADLRILYGHFNGCSESIDGYYRLLSLSEMLTHKRMLDRLEKQGHFADWQPGTWWNGAWLPFAWFEGDYLAIDLAGKLAKPRGQIFEFRANTPARNLIYRSLATWLETLVRIIEMAPVDAAAYGAFFATPAAKRLRKKLAPRYPIARAAAPARATNTKGAGKFQVYQRGPYRWRIGREGTTVVTGSGRGYSMLERRQRFSTPTEATAFMKGAIARKVTDGYHHAGQSTYQ